MKKIVDVAFYRQVLDKVNANIYITDVETDGIVWMNDVMKQTFGPDPPGVLNRRGSRAGRAGQGRQAKTDEGIQIRISC